jgi:hypothetical protein
MTYRPGPVTYRPGACASSTAHAIVATAIPATTRAQTVAGIDPSRIYFAPSANSWLRLVMKIVFPTATGVE